MEGRCEPGRLWWLRGRGRARPRYEGVLLGPDPYEKMATSNVHQGVPRSREPVGTKLDEGLRRLEGMGVTNPAVGAVVSQTGVWLIEKRFAERQGASERSERLHIEQVESKVRQDWITAKEALLVVRMGAEGR